MPDTTEGGAPRAEGSLGRRLAWFFGIALASALGTALVA